MDVGDVKLYRIIYICMMCSVEQMLKCHGVKNQSFATDCYPGIGDNFIIRAGEKRLGGSVRVYHVYVIIVYIQMYK